MKRSVALVVLSSAVLLSACSSLGRAARVDPASVSMRSAPTDVETACPVYVSTFTGDKRTAINLDCFTFSGGEYTAYELATDPGTHKYLETLDERVEAMRLARNRLGFVLVNQADAICEDEKGTLYSARALSAGAFDFLSSGFSGASTIVGGEQAKSILSGLAGLSTATRTNIDANVYQNQLISAITKVMDAERAEILGDLRSKQSETIAQFSADEMIVIANHYHQACSFQKGVQLLLDAALNKEGVDKIIKSMNLRGARSSLEQALNNPSLQDAESQDKLRAQLLEVILRETENAKSATDVITDAAEGEPVEADPFAPFDPAPNPEPDPEPDPVG